MNKEKFPTRPDHRLFQDGCQIAVSTDVGLTVDTDSGIADNKYCFNLVFNMNFKRFAIVLILWIDMQPESCLVHLVVSFHFVRIVFQRVWIMVYINQAPCGM